MGAYGARARACGARVRAPDSRAYARARAPPRRACLAGRRPSAPTAPRLPAGRAARGAAPRSFCLRVPLTRVPRGAGCLLFLPPPCSRALTPPLSPPRWTRRSTASWARVRIRAVRVCCWSSRGSVCGRTHKRMRSGVVCGLCGAGRGAGPHSASAGGCVGCGRRAGSGLGKPGMLAHALRPLPLPALALFFQAPAPRR